MNFSIKVKIRDRTNELSRIFRDTIPQSASDKSKKGRHLRISLKVFTFGSDGLEKRMLASHHTPANSPNMS